MILRPRSYAVLAIGSLAAFVALRLAVAVWFDPFADFYYLTGWRSTDFHSVEQFSERKIKRRMIEDAPPGAITAAVFGNSRTAAMDPTGLDGKAVNLAFSGARTEEVAVLLRRFKQLHPQAQALVGLDFDQCFAPVSGNSLYLDPASDGDAWRDAWLRLSSLQSLESWFKASIMGHALPQTIARDGHVIRRALGSDQSAARRQVDLDVYGGFFQSSDYRRDCVVTAQQLITIDPQVILFINPISTPMRNVIETVGKLDYLGHWRESLSKVAVAVLDFTCSSALSDGVFLDGHHYGDVIAQAMVADLAAVRAGTPPRWGCALKP